MVSIWVDIIAYSSPLEFFKICLMLKAKITALSDGVSMYVDVKHKTIAIRREHKGT